MSIHVVVTALIYHALNGRAGPSAATKGLWLKFHLSVKGAGARPKAALLRLWEWPPGAHSFGAERLWHQRRGHRTGCFWCRGVGVGRGSPLGILGLGWLGEGVCLM